MNKSIIAFVAGRSGGHIIPALTLARQYKNLLESEIIFFTTAHPLDQAIIKKQGSFINKHICLKLGNVPFFNIFKFIIFLFAFIRAFFISFLRLRQLRPEKIVGMGGYICVPVCLASYFLKIPIELYDLDAKPGRATRFLKRYAQKILICFEQAKDYLPAEKTEIVDYPIRFDPQAKQTSQEAAVQTLGLSSQKKTIFINGGSQGSVFVNKLIKEWLDFNPHIYSLIQIIHQTGSADSTNWKNYYKDLEIPALVFTYKEDLALFYSAADLVICRSGAGSLFEALFFEKQCLTIPLETKNTRHQLYNAQSFCQKYSHLFAMLTESEIKKDNMTLFRILNKSIYSQSFTGSQQYKHDTLEHSQ